MRIGENEYSVIDNAENITGIDYEIKWFDKDTLDGYIEEDNLICIIDDLLNEIDRLNEEIEELKKPKEDDYEELYRERKVLGI